MRWYRLYCVSERGSFVDVKDIERESDAEALRAAREMLGELPKCDSIEVWERARLVGQADRKAEAESAAQASL